MRHFAELIRIADKVAVAAVPEVDIHNAVRNPDILLFGSFAQPVRILTGDEFLEFRFFIFGQRLSVARTLPKRTPSKLSKSHFRDLIFATAELLPSKYSAMSVSSLAV